ncbi:hypothetical protein ALC53_06383 [Atta colombica]|uniref:Ig-like domain-containing protein n=1 Tax=Atta colombica TaxID=520822 RepID=A0A195BG09_9HYME|nr:hypothetical protein ALC53_06383 [Atta colombica]
MRRVRRRPGENSMVRRVGHVEGTLSLHVGVPISHIVALVGDSAYLPCDISTTHEGDSVHLVLWYREDLGTSVYSIDARNREFGVAERWSDNSVFSNRAYFMLDKQPALLGVENTREEDAGIYRCRVDFQIGQTRNSKVNLTVIGKVYFNYSFTR